MWLNLKFTVINAYLQIYNKKNKDSVHVGFKRKK